MGFAHRGLHHGAAFPENSMAAFAAALETGAGIECDLRLSADDRIVVFHDADAQRLCGSRLVIGRSTFAELGGLRLGDRPLPTLDDLLKLVAGRVPLLLECKVDGDLWRWVPALRSSLDGYLGPFGLMSFDPRLPRLLKTHWPCVFRGLVIRASLPTWKRVAALRLAAPQFAAVDVAALGEAWVDRLRRRMPVYIWTVRDAAQRSKARVHADAPIWEADGRP